jgi:YcxB-like protein
MTEVAFAGQLTEADYRRVNAVVARKVILAWSGGLALIILVQLWQWGWRGVLANPTWAAIVFVPLILVMPFSLLLRRFTWRRHWRANKTLQKPVRGRVSEEGITWDVDGVASTRFTWDLLLKYREAQSILLIYQGLNQVFYFFPHYFADEAQWQAFRAIVATKLPRK